MNILTLFIVSIILISLSSCSESVSNVDLKRVPESVIQGDINEYKCIHLGTDVNKSIKTLFPDEKEYPQFKNGNAKRIQSKYEKVRRGSGKSSSHKPKCTIVVYYANGDKELRAELNVSNRLYSR